MNQLPRRALSRYGLTFQGNILSVNCQFRMRTRVRRTHSTSPVENSLITNLKWFTEFGHLNRGDMLTSEQHRCHNEKK
ncbi:hypothetical protein ODS09_08745, partial [Escherichia coli]|nr:hypothetical protein [Escherichia coli]